LVLATRLEIILSGLVLSLLLAFTAMLLSLSITLALLTIIGLRAVASSAFSLVRSCGALAHNRSGIASGSLLSLLLVRLIKFFLGHLLLFGRLLLFVCCVIGVLLCLLCILLCLLCVLLCLFLELVGLLPLLVCFLFSRLHYVLAWDEVHI
jgi:hypothetical protein